MRRSIFAAALFALSSPVLLAAQGTLIPRPCPVPQPPPCRDGRCPIVDPMPCPTFEAIVRTSSVVHASIVGRVVKYEVSETFLNRGGRVGEADYIFPLPKGAAFEDLKLSINGELVSGETLPADRARGIYEDIVRRMRDPALVEWMGAGMLRTRIFPIQPGEEKRVVVRFQSLLEREGNAVRVDYVRGTPPRAQRGGIMRRVDDDVDSRTGGDEESSNAFVLSWPRSTEYGDPYSPTHMLRTRDRDGARIATASGDGREVTILLPLRHPDATGVTVLAHRPGDEDGFALIAITPPATPRRTIPRDLTFVVDVSGSMRGDKLAQAKAAGRRLLESLGPQDRFRIIDFSTDVRYFREEWSPATTERVRAARRYLDDLRAEGSTNISGALDEALHTRPVDGRLPLVVFVTDGEPTVGERNPDAIAALAARQRGDNRIFAFGVSADVNATLIEQLALEGHGTAHFVRQGESVERAVSVLASRLTSPVVTGLRVRAEGITLRQLQPSGPVDLYAGQDLIVLARYDGDGTGRLRLEGHSPTGDVSWTTQARFPRRERNNPFVARLWAAQRLGWLAAEKRRHGGTSELDAEIRTLGETYGIPTEFSSYLVVEPGMRLARGQTDATLQSVVTAGAAPGASVDQSRRNAAAAPSAPPAAELRFEAAKSAAAQREMKSVAALDEVTSGSGAGLKRVGTRIFSLREKTWTDSRYVPGMPAVRVKAYSPLYFALVSRLDGLSEALVLGDRVIVAGRAVAIEIAPDGAERVDDTVVADLVRNW
jgi:Ca-activated chloride channel homolog